MRRPVRIAVTGAAGSIANNLLFKIASGEMMGKDQPVILQLIEVPQAMEALRGIAMELEDCAFPLLAGVVHTIGQRRDPQAGPPEGPRVRGAHATTASAPRRSWIQPRSGTSSGCGSK